MLKYFSLFIRELRLQRPDPVFSFEHQCYILNIICMLYIISWLRSLVFSFEHQCYILNIICMLYIISWLRSLVFSFEHQCYILNIICMLYIISWLRSLVFSFEHQCYILNIICMLYIISWLRSLVFSFEHQCYILNIICMLYIISWLQITVIIFYYDIAKIRHYSAFIKVFKTYILTKWPWIHYTINLLSVIWTDFRFVIYFCIFIIFYTLYKRHWQHACYNVFILYCLCISFLFHILLTLLWSSLASLQVLKSSCYYASNKI